MADNKSKNLITPPGIGSYVFVLEPRADQQGKLYYSLALLVAKNREAELAPLRNLVQQVAVEKFGAKAGDLMKAGKIRNPIRDGDLEKPEDKNYKGVFFMSMKTNKKPGIIDAKKNEVFTDDDVYSGCLLRCSVNVYAYDTSGNKGVGLWLNNIQVLHKGTRLDGRKAATEEFDEYQDTEADPLG